jgi:hypothetical protein
MQNKQRWLNYEIGNLKCRDLGADKKVTDRAKLWTRVCRAPRPATRTLITGHVTDDDVCPSVDGNGPHPAGSRSENG